MQKFWEKTKNNLTVSLNVAMDVTGTLKIDEDPEFIEISNQINKILNDSKVLRSQIEEMGINYIKNIKSQISLNYTFTTLFEPNDGEILTISKKSYQNIKYLEDLSIKFIEEFIPNFILSSLNNLENQIFELTKISEKRKKNLIIMKNYEKSKNNNLIDKIAHYRAKFTHYNSLYLNNSKELFSKKNVAFSQCFKGYQSFIFKLYNLFNEKFNENLNNFNFNKILNDFYL